MKRLMSQKKKKNKYKPWIGKLTIKDNIKTCKITWKAFNLNLKKKKKKKIDWCQSNNILLFNKTSKYFFLFCF